MSHFTRLVRDSETAGSAGSATLPWGETPHTPIQGSPVPGRDWPLQTPARPGTGPRREGLM